MDICPSLWEFEIAWLISGWKRPWCLRTFFKSVQRNGGSLKVLRSLSETNSGIKEQRFPEMECYPVTPFHHPCSSDFPQQLCLGKARFMETWSKASWTIHSHALRSQLVVFPIGRCRAKHFEPILPFFKRCDHEVELELSWAFSIPRSYRHSIDAYCCVYPWWLGDPPFYETATWGVKSHHP